MAQIGAETEQTRLGEKTKKSATKRLENKHGDECKALLGPTFILLKKFYVLTIFLKVALRSETLMKAMIKARCADVILRIYLS